MEIASPNEFAEAVYEIDHQLSTNEKTRCLYEPFVILVVTTDQCAQYDNSTWTGAFKKERELRDVEHDKALAEEVQRVDIGNRSKGLEDVITKVVTLGA